LYQNKFYEINHIQNHDYRLFIQTHNWEFENCFAYAPIFILLWFLICSYLSLNCVLFNIFIGLPVLVLHRRTRAVFDVAIKVHRNIQERDIEVGRNVGNFILRCLDRMKPSAQIRNRSSLPTSGSSSKETMTKHETGTSNHKPPGHSGLFKKDSDRHFFTSSKPFPSISRMMIPPNPAGTTIHGRNLSTYSPETFRQNYRVNWSGSVIRKDIMQWML